MPRPGTAGARPTRPPRLPLAPQFYAVTLLLPLLLKLHTGAAAWSTKVCLISGSSSADDLRVAAMVSAWANFTAEVVQRDSNNNYENVNCAALGSKQCDVVWAMSSAGPLWATSNNGYPSNCGAFGVVTSYRFLAQDSSDDLCLTTNSNGDTMSSTAFDSLHYQAWHPMTCGLGGSLALGASALSGAAEYTTMPSGSLVMAREESNKARMLSMEKGTVVSCTPTTTLSRRAALWFSSSDTESTVIGFPGEVFVRRALMWAGQTNSAPGVAQGSVSNFQLAKAGTTGAPRLVSTLLADVAFSDANYYEGGCTLAGIAIVSNGTVGTGNWEYRRGLSAWATFPAGLGEGNALLLLATDAVRLTNESVPGTYRFVFRAWDRSPVGEPGFAPPQPATTFSVIGKTGGEFAFSSETVFARQDVAAPSPSTTGQLAWATTGVVSTTGNVGTPLSTTASQTTSGVPTTTGPANSVSASTSATTLAQNEETSSGGSAGAFPLWIIFVVIGVVCMLAIVAGVVVFRRRQGDAGGDAEPGHELDASSTATDDDGVVVYEDVNDLAESSESDEDSGDGEVHYADLASFKSNPESR
jgi:hypothetical protein